MATGQLQVEYSSVRLQQGVVTTELNKTMLIMLRKKLKSENLLARSESEALLFGAEHAKRSFSPEFVAKQHS